MSKARLFKPEYLEGVIRSIPPGAEIVGGVITSFKPRKVSRIKHFKRYFNLLGPKGLFIMGGLDVISLIQDKLSLLLNWEKRYSLRGVLEKYSIPYIASKNVNAAATIQWIKERHCDVILCSGNQIFKKKLLSTPKICCINRHTSILPSYGGIYPIFWALLYGEESTGVSIHIMTESLDEGHILAFRERKIYPGETFFAIFKEMFKLSVDVTIEALEKIAAGDLDGVVTGREKSYFSYPTPRDVKLFKARGHRMF